MQFSTSIISINKKMRMPYLIVVNAKKKKKIHFDNLDLRTPEFILNFVQGCN